VNYACYLTDKETDDKHGDGRRKREQCVHVCTHNGKRGFGKCKLTIKCNVRKYQLMNNTAKYEMIKAVREL